MSFAKDDDGFSTATSELQHATELACHECSGNTLELQRTNHVAYAIDALLGQYPPGFARMDSSRCWLIYWNVHSLSLMNALDSLYEPSVDEKPNESVLSILDWFGRCQNETGGFGGSPGHKSHMAPTYAAVMSLVIIGKTYPDEAYGVINRRTLSEFMARCKLQNGPYRMCEMGEYDTRASYCAVAVGSVLGLLTPAAKAGLAEWLAECQTYEGGMGGEPGNEAHGGYTFCALAALLILGKSDLINVARLLHWSAHRQRPVEGGFQGRTNKLVDGCYSYWVGALFPLIDFILGADTDIEDTKSATDVKMQDDEDDGITSTRAALLFDVTSLQRYILTCCQHPYGGLRDKPPVRSDSYHTCYCLSGLAYSQQGSDGPFMSGAHFVESNALYNVDAMALEAALAFFKDRAL